jgi:hypothetical protein
VPFAGTLTGDYSNTTGCLEFIEAGDVAIEGGEAAIPLNGEVSLEDPEVGSITAD